MVVKLQDDLLAELEELELEADLFEVGEPFKSIDVGDPINELPEVRKCSVKASACNVNLDSIYHHRVSLILSDSYAVKYFPTPSLSPPPPPPPPYPSINTNSYSQTYKEDCSRRE